MPVSTAADPLALLAIEDPELLLDAITVTDVSGTIRAVNRGFTRLHGYAAAEVVGRRPDVLSSGLQQPDFYTQLWATIAAGRPWEGELVDRGADGRLRTVRSRIVPVRGPGGAISSFVALQRAITPPARVAGTGHLRIDVRGRCTYADAEAATLLRGDVDAAALLGSGLLRATCGEDAAALREVLERTVATARCHHLDVAVPSGYVRCAVALDPTSRGLTAGPVTEVTCIATG